MSHKPGAWNLERSHKSGMSAGPNTLVGLSKSADASAPFDHDSAIKALLPAYIKLLTQLKALGVPEVQMHEPILTTSDAASLKTEFESTYSQLSRVGVPINLVSDPCSPCLNTPHDCKTIWGPRAHRLLWCNVSCML